MPYCFPRSSIKFQGHTVQNITDFDPNWAFPDYRPVAALKSLRFALLESHPDLPGANELTTDPCSNFISSLARTLWGAITYTCPELNDGLSISVSK